MEERCVVCTASHGMAEIFSASNIRFSKQATVFNWEYQCFATYNKQRLGLRLNNGETIVACVADRKPEVYSALSIIPHGRGKIIFNHT